MYVWQMRSDPGARAQPVPPRERRESAVPCERARRAPLGAPPGPASRSRLGARWGLGWAAVVLISGARAYCPVCVRCAPRAGARSERNVRVWAVASGSRECEWRVAARPRAGIAAFYLAFLLIFVSRAGLPARRNFVRSKTRREPQSAVPRRHATRRARAGHQSADCERLG